MIGAGREAVKVPGFGEQSEFFRRTVNTII